MRVVELVRGRLWLVGLGSIAILGLISLAVLHAAPVRARLLAWIASRLEPSGIAFHADRLDYDLTRLDVRIRGLTLASLAAPAEPFLRAEEVHAVLGWAVLLGRIDVDVLELVHPRVTLVRTAGTAGNWPSDSQAGRVGQASYDIHFGRVRIPNLDIEWRDAVTGLNADVRGLSIDLIPEDGETAGPLRLTGPARVRWNGRDTSINALEGRLSWNSRDLSIDALRVVLAEGRLQMDGRVQALTGDRRVDLRIASDSDLAAIAPWLSLDRRLTGAIHIDATVTGSPSALEALITAKGRDIGVDDLRPVQLETSGHVAGNAVELTTLSARVAGGSINGRGRIGIDGSAGAIRLEWQQLDVAILMRSALRHDMQPEPGALATGSLDAQWTAPRMETLRVRSGTRLAASRGGGETASRRRAQRPARVPIEGWLTVDIEHQHLALRADAGLAGVERAETKAPGVRQDIERGNRARIDVASRLDAGDLQRSSLTGTIHVNASDLAGIARLLARLGIADAPELTGGAAQGDFSLGGTIGDARLTGSLDAQEVRYGALNPATLHTRVSATRTEIRLDDIRGSLEGSLAHGGLRLNVASGGIDGQIDAALNDFSGLVNAAGLPLRVDGTLDGRVIISGSINSPQVAGTLTTTRLATAGQQIDRLQSDLRLENRAVAIDRLCLSMKTENDTSLENPANPDTSGNSRPPTRSCQLEARGRVDLARHTYAVNATVDRLPVRPVSDVNGNVLAPLATTVSGEIDGDGSFTNLNGRGRLTLADTQWARSDVGRIEAVIAVEGRRVSADIRAPALAVTANAAVGVDPGGELVVHGRWEPDDVAGIARRFGWSAPFPFSGSAALGLEVEGSRDRLKDLHVTAVVDRVDLDVDTQRVQLEQAARLEYDGRTALVRDLRLTTGTSTLTVAGSVGEAAPGLTATLRGSLADFAFVQRFAQSAIRNPQSASETVTTGSIDFRIDATGPLERPALSGMFRVSDGQWPLTPEHAVTGANLSARYVSGVLTIEQLDATLQGAALDARGRIPADLFRDRLPPRWHDLVPQSAGPADLTIRVSSLTPQIAAPFTDPSTLEQLQGRVDASISLQADRAALEHLTGTVTLDRAELSVSGVSLDQQRPTRLVVRNGRVDVADWDWGRGDNHLVLTGGLMLAGTQALDFTARTTLDLRLLGAFTSPARPGGRADAEVRVGGTVNDPRIDGFVTFANGELRLADPRLIVSDLAGTLTFAGDTIRLERLWAAVNGGGTEIAGSLRHRWFKPLDGAITLRGREAAFELSGLRAEVDADLSLTLERRGPVVSGTATLVRSSYREPLSLTGGLLQTLRASSAFGRPATRSALDDVRLDVRVVTGDDLLVDNNYARLAASADFRLVGTLAQPVPLGAARLAEGGTIFFGGNRYRLENQGSIDFSNPTTIEPDLDLRAVTNVSTPEGAAEIRLEIKGTPATLQTTLNSNKSYSQSDLISLLVTGRTQDDRAAGGSTPGAEELLGYLSGELFGTAARAIGVDVVRIERGTPGLRFDAGLVANETDPAARLTFGKNIGRSTQVVFSQSLRESGALTWIVSYAPRSPAELRAVALDSGDRLYDFSHDVVFGKPPAAPTRAPAPAPRVGAVHISGAGADEKTLRRLLRLGAGDRFSFFRWQDDRERLERFYHERDHAEARVTTRRSDGGGAETTEISYDIRPGPRSGIVIEGFAFPGRVSDALKAAWTHAVIDEFLIAEVETIVRGELVDRGYVGASVAATLSGASDMKQLRVLVEPGPHSGDRRIAFEGNRYLSTEQLREAIRDPELARAVWLNPERVSAHLAALYRSEGYLNAAVRLSEIGLEGSVATRSISVTEGEPFHVREIRIEGVGALSASDIATVSGLAPGGMFSEGLIERARRAITAAYRKQGFNSVGITVRSEAARERPEVDVAIEVEEGAQQRLRDVVTKGLARTRPGLVSRALQLEPGQPVDLTAWSNARRRLYETGMFRSVDIEPEPMAPAGAEASVPNEQPTRATVTIEEWPPVRLRYGLEVQDRQSSAGDAGRAVVPEPESGGGRSFDVGVASDLGMRSLFGRAISAGVAGRYTRDFRAARTYVTTPSMFGLPIISNIFLSRSREALGEAADRTMRKFVTDISSLTLEQRTRPRPDLEVSYRYGFEHNHTFDLQPDPDNPLPFDVPVTVARLATTVLFDTRNDLVDARRGWFHSSDFEYSPTSLGSDVRFVKYLLQQRYYRTTGRVVVAGAARVGLASAFGQFLIPSERFFAGGGNSVRGYAEEVLSPQDVLGSAIGGTALIVLNGEARFPVFKMVRGVGFFDAGRAFEGVKAITLRDLSAGTGVGLRVETPVVLLRVDFGLPLDGSSGPRRGRWFFSVGQAF
jgi:outer membrane protein assembly factor BamA/autotransporter translocation and assembly factor TamB